MCPFVHHYTCTFQNKCNNLLEKSIHLHTLYVGKNQDGADHIVIKLQYYFEPLSAFNSDPTV